MLRYDPAPPPIFWFEALAVSSNPAPKLASPEVAGPRLER